jgi:hypothetical protein
VPQVVQAHIRETDPLSDLHAFVGEPESLKSFAGQSAGAEALRAGRDVVYLDFEDSPGAVFARMRDLGVSDELLASGFHYVRPVEPLTDAAWLDLAPTLARDVHAVHTPTGVDGGHGRWMVPSPGPTHERRACLRPRGLEPEGGPAMRGRGLELPSLRHGTVVQPASLAPAGS